MPAATVNTAAVSKEPKLSIRPIDPVGRPNHPECFETSPAYFWSRELVFQCDREKHNVEHQREGDKMVLHITRHVVDVAIIRSVELFLH